MNKPLKKEIAQLLKEKGFDANIVPTIGDIIIWFYDKYGIWIEVKHNIISEEFFYEIMKNDTSKTRKSDYRALVAYSYLDEPLFKVPLDAYEHAIEYTLNNLI